MGRNQKLMAESKGIVMLMEMNKTQKYFKKVCLTKFKEEKNQMGHTDLLLEQLHGVESLHRAGNWETGQVWGERFSF